MSLLRRLCPHIFGWSYNTHRRRRWCRLCAQQQRRVPWEAPGEGDRWEDVPPVVELIESGDILEAQKRMLADLERRRGRD